jgi:FHS family L-fucose permease-like MFS transporter
MAITRANKTLTPSTAPGHSYRGAIAMVTTLFFTWGFCTVLNDALIPHLQSIFSLTYLQASLIQLAFFGSYFVFAQPAGWLVERIGYQRTMVAGLVTMSVGALLFVPAATSARYAFFLGAQMVLAAGVTILQVAANPYVTILGSPETASSRLNLTQAFNTLGDTVAPYVGSILILGGAAAGSSVVPRTGPALSAYRIQQAASVKLPYIGIAVVLVILALALAVYRFPRLEVTRDFRPASLEGKQDSVWQHPHLYLGAIAIFVYVGAEVSIGTFLARYLADPLIGNMSLQRATQFVTLYWGSMMVGRFFGAALMRRVAAHKMLALFAIGAGIMITGSLLGSGYFALATVLAVGLFNSIMFPTIFTLAVAELGSTTARGSGLLIQAIVGAALIPVLMGHLADRYGIHHALALPLLCYVFILFYGVRGYRIRADEPKAEIQAVAG